MPGRTPAEAVDNFLRPIQAALACVARARIVRGQTGDGPLELIHSWVAGGPAGLDLGGTRNLQAAMWYRILRDGDRYRVSTTGYEYAYSVDDGELFAMHWHPHTAFKSAHLHLGPRLRLADGALPAKHHLPTPRMTFEEAIRWVIQCGAPPLCHDWEEKLKLSEFPHLAHASWTHDPDVRNYSPRHAAAPDEY